MPKEKSNVCISFLPSLNTQFACSMKRGQTNRRVPSNDRNKQEAHGHHHSPEKTLEKQIFKFCQCIFAISQLSPLGKGCGPSFEQNWISLTQGYFVPSLVEICPWFWRRKLLNSVNAFLLFRMPLEKSMVLHLNKHESHSPKIALCQVRLILPQWFWRRFLKILLKSFY